MLTQGSLGPVWRTLVFIKPASVEITPKRAFPIDNP